MESSPTNGLQGAARDSGVETGSSGPPENSHHDRSKRPSRALHAPSSESELSPEYGLKKRFKRRTFHSDSAGSDTEESPQSSSRAKSAPGTTPNALHGGSQPEKDPESPARSRLPEAEPALTTQNPAEMGPGNDDNNNSAPEEETLFGYGEDAKDPSCADEQGTRGNASEPNGPAPQDGPTSTAQPSAEDLHFKTEDLYENIVQKLSFDESQRFFCYTLERLAHTHKEALNRLKRLEEKGMEHGATDSVVDRCYIPFHSGSSLFYMEGKRRDHYSRFLAYNACGVVILTAQAAMASKETPSAKDCIEIVSSIAGVGQRRRTLNNAVKRFNMAAIGPNGFCLARGYAFGDRRARRHDADGGPSAAEWRDSDADAEEYRNGQSDSEREAQQSDDNEDAGNHILLSGAAGHEEAEEGLEAPCYLEYHAFNTWGPVSKSWWSKTFSRNEALYGVTVGNQWIAAITSKRLLRIFSHTGLAMGVIRLCGLPVTVVAAGSRLMTITVQARAPLSSYTGSHFQRRTKGLGCDTTFDCRVFDVASMTEVVHAPFSAPSGAHLVWAGFTPRLMPLIVESSGDVWAMLPVFSTGCRKTTGFPSTSSRPGGQFTDGDGLTTRWDWVPVLDLKETLPPHQATRIALDYGHSVNDTGRHPTSISRYIWIGGAEESGLRAIRLSRRQRAPPPNPDLVLLTCPFCVPVLQSASTERQLSYLDWTAHLADDPDFRDMAKVAALPWEVFDELRLRFELERRHIRQILSGSTDSSHDSKPLSPQERNKIVKLDQKLAVKLDKTLFRLFMKAVSENRVERALEAAEKFAFSKTFEVARAQAEARAMKSLAEKLNAEIEKRLIAETEEVTRRQLQNCAINLRDVEVVSAAAITPGQSKRDSDPQHVSLAKTLRLQAADAFSGSLN